jgi:hypothetical protein
MVQLQYSFPQYDFTFLRCGPLDQIPSSAHWITACITHMSLLSDESATQMDIEIPQFPFPNPLQKYAVTSASLETFANVANDGNSSTSATLANEAFPAIRMCARLFLCISSPQPLIETVSGPIASSSSWSHRIADGYVRASGGNLSLLHYLPALLRSVVEMSLHQCTENPVNNWPDSLMELIGRNDLSLSIKAKNSSTSSNLLTGAISSQIKQTSDGLLEVELAANQLRFAEDDRVHEVCRMLRSSRQIYLRVNKAPETSGTHKRTYKCINSHSLAQPVHIDTHTNL